MARSLRLPRVRKMMCRSQIQYTKFDAQRRRTARTRICVDRCLGRLRLLQRQAVTDQHDHRRLKSLVTYKIANKDIIASIVKAAVNVLFRVRTLLGNECYLPHADDRRAMAMIV